MYYYVVNHKVHSVRHTESTHPTVNRLCHQTGKWNQTDVNGTNNIYGGVMNVERVANRTLNQKKLNETLLFNGVLPFHDDDLLIKGHVLEGMEIYILILEFVNTLVNCIRSPRRVFKSHG